MIDREKLWLAIEVVRGRRTREELSATEFNIMTAQEQLQLAYSIATGRMKYDDLTLTELIDVGGPLSQKSLLEWADNFIFGSCITNAICTQEKAVCS